MRRGMLALFLILAIGLSVVTATSAPTTPAQAGGRASRGAWGTFTSISTSYIGFTCALNTAGAAWCWGNNDDGRLGNGTTVSSTVPVPVTMPAGVTFTAIAAGYKHVCAISTTGDAYCWGTNTYGQLGDGTRVARTVPTKVVEMPTNVYLWLPAAHTLDFDSISAGYLASCGHDRTTGYQYCWGAYGTGEIGFAFQCTGYPELYNGSTTFGGPTYCTKPHVWQTSDSPYFMNFGAPSMSTNKSCAILTPPLPPYTNEGGSVGAGSFVCWGLETNYTPPYRFYRVIRTDPRLTFTTIAVSYAHQCALSTVGKAYCWGTNTWGQLGDSSTDTRTDLNPVWMDSGLAFSKIAVGYGHTCAISTVGDAWCWGGGGWGQLGSGTLADFRVPEKIIMPGGELFASISAGYEHTCALTTTGDAYCWGTNTYGQLGTCDTLRHSAPTLVGAPCPVDGSVTVTPTSGSTATATKSATPTTAAATMTASRTATAAVTGVPATATKTLSPTKTATATKSATATPSATSTKSPTVTRSATPTGTNTRTATNTPAITATLTRSATKSPTRTPTKSGAKPTKTPTKKK